MLLFGFIFVTFAAVGITIAGYRLIRYPTRDLRGRLSVHELGRLEGSLPGLRTVIVVADQIEDPTDELRKAVKNNLANGVRYLFLVSKSKGEGALDGYYNIFKTLAAIVIKKQQKAYEVEDLVDIQELPYDWPDYPYVFYETIEQGKTTFVAFRGNQQNEGIADFYSPVDAHYAHTIARAVLSEAPHAISVRSDQFANGATVLPFSTARPRETA